MFHFILCIKKYMRTFKVIDVRKHGGCKTKFKEGRYTSSTPMGAAKKTFTRLCKLKKIRGRCTLIVTVQETTLGSNKKQFSYKLSRKLLKKPIIRLAGTDKEFKIKYKVQANAVKKVSKCPLEKKGQTPGRMKGGGNKIVFEKAALRALDRRKLQGLCKARGIKANSKTVKLVEQLVENEDNMKRLMSASRQHDDILNRFHTKEETSMGRNIVGGMKIKNLETGTITEYCNNEKQVGNYPEIFLICTISSIYSIMYGITKYNLFRPISITKESFLKEAPALLNNLINYCNNKNGKCVFLLKEINKIGIKKWSTNLMKKAEKDMEHQFNQRLPEETKKLIKNQLPRAINTVKFFVQLYKSDDEEKKDDSNLKQPPQHLIAPPEDISESILKTINENAQNMFDNIKHYGFGENIGQTEQIHVEELITESINRACEQIENQIRRTNETTSEEIKTGHHIVMIVAIMYMVVRSLLFLTHNRCKVKKKRLKQHNIRKIVPY